MTMALAVAMVACEAATSTPKPGEKGDTGDQGPPGPTGTPDNELPMATKPLSMVYLALKGTGAMPNKTGIDLSKHFMDAENASLTYKPESSDKTVATVEVKAGMLSVMGKGAGMATVTVKAYDGVNLDPAMSSFEVMVVASNAGPVVVFTTGTSVAEDPSALTSSGSPLLGEQQLLRNKLFITNVRGKTTISATIHAGNDPFSDDVTFSIDMGADGKDDVVDVELTPKSGAANMWEVKLTPLNAGMQNVYVTVKDKFGATGETPISGDGNDDDMVDDDDEVTDQRFQFVAFVNTVPELDMAIPDKTLVVGNTHDYQIADHFDTGEAPVTAGPKIGKMHKLAEAPGLFATTGVANGGAIGATQRANDTACSAASSDTAVASVTYTDGSSDGTLITIATAGAPTFDELKETVAVRVTGGAPGNAVITITCRDNEGSATGTATVTVRAARS